MNYRQFLINEIQNNSSSFGIECRNDSLIVLEGWYRMIFKLSRLDLVKDLFE